MADWWAEFFGARYAGVGLESDSDAAKLKLDRTVDCLVTLLQLQPGHRVFDQCAGVGRVGIPLALRHLQVVGVEQSSKYVEIGNERAQAAGADCTLVVGDAFEYRCEPRCHAAINWFSSFGYTPDDALNIEMFRRAYDSLLPKGRFAIEFINLAWVLKNISTSRVSRFQEGDKELMLIEEPSLNLARGVFESRWTWILDGVVQQVQNTIVRALMPHEAARLLQEAGFVNLSFYGDLDGGPLTRESRRTLIVAERL